VERPHLRRGDAEKLDARSFGRGIHGGGLARGSEILHRAGRRRRPKVDVLAMLLQRPCPNGR
jgi:hypothetical protein